MNALTLALAAASLLFATFNAGAFLAFWTFVMPGLNRLDGRTAAAAMQQINVTAPAPFIVSLAGGVLAPAAAFVVMLATGHGGEWFALGAAVAGLATFLITGAVNVPLNNALAAADAGRFTATEWARWSRAWGRPNAVRSLTASAAVLLVAAALV